MDLCLLMCTREPSVAPPATPSLRHLLLEGHPQGLPLPPEGLVVPQLAPPEGAARGGVEHVVPHDAVALGVQPLQWRGGTLTL